MDKMDKNTIIQYDNGYLSNSSLQLLRHNKIT